MEQNHQYQAFQWHEEDRTVYCEDGFGHLQPKAYWLTLLPQSPRLPQKRSHRLQAVSPIRQYVDVWDRTQHCHRHPLRLHTNTMRHKVGNSYLFSLSLSVLITARNVPSFNVTNRWVFPQKLFIQKALRLFRTSPRTPPTICALGKERRLN